MIWTLLFLFPPLFASRESGESAFNLWKRKEFIKVISIFQRDSWTSGISRCRPPKIGTFWKKKRKKERKTPEFFRKVRHHNHLWITTVSEWYIGKSLAIVFPRHSRQVYNPQLTRGSSEAPPLKQWTEWIRVQARRVRAVELCYHVS